MGENQSNGNKENKMSGIKHPFHVPEAYFDTLYEDILEKKSIVRSQRRLVSYKWVTVAVAASISFIAVTWTGLFLFRSNSDINSLSDVSTEAIIEYLASEDVTYDWLVEMNMHSSFDIEDINTFEQGLPSEDIDDESLQMWLNEYSQDENEMLL